MEAVSPDFAFSKRKRSRLSNPISFSQFNWENEFNSQLNVMTFRLTNKIDVFLLFLKVHTVAWKLGYATGQGMCYQEEKRL